MRHTAYVALAACVSALGVSGATVGLAGGSTARVASIACSTEVATAPTLRTANPQFAKTAEDPFGVAAEGRYAFVAGADGALYVYDDSTYLPRLVQAIDLPSEGAGVGLTANGRYLLVAVTAGVAVVDVARAEAGSRHAVLGVLSTSGVAGSGGPIEVVASRDGRYAFLSIEYAQQIQVFRLAAAIAHRFRGSFYVGAIGTGIAPVGLAVSRDGRWLYSTSEAEGGLRSQGELQLISIARAEREPSKAVVATVAAGCQPVRVAVSPSGAVAWITARASDELVAFSTAGLLHHVPDPILAQVRVGEAPVGVVLADDGADAVVADSNRFGQRGASAGLTIVDTSAALNGGNALIGDVRAGQFPREMAVEPGGRTVLVGNFESDQLEVITLPVSTS